MAKKTIPAISIIIPMYNTEKYIGECLDSILAQTFDDYEVIVVDNCSTDDSAKIVESYIPKFTKNDLNRLSLVHHKYNSGNAAIPRNTGIRFSRGKYIYFMDSDDIILKNTLKIFYNAAEKFNADVVHCEKWYKSSDEIGILNKKFTETDSWNPKKNSFDNPFCVSKNLNERVSEFTNYKFGWTPWLHFIRRDLVVKNNIEFPDLINSEDVLFSFYILSLAENILYIPDVLYVWRIRQNSMTFMKLPVDKQVHKKVYDIFQGISILEKFIKKFNLFQDHLEYRNKVFEFFTVLQMNSLLYIYGQIPAYKLDGLIRRELEQIKDKTALTAFLFGRMNVFNVNLLQQQNIIRQQQAQIQQLQARLQQSPNSLNLNNEDIFKLN